MISQIKIDKRFSKKRFCRICNALIVRKKKSAVYCWDCSKLRLQIQVKNNQIKTKLKKEMKTK